MLRPPTSTCCWDPHLHMLLRPPPLHAAETPTCCLDPRPSVPLRPPPPHGAEIPTSPCCWDPHLSMLLRPPLPHSAETPTSPWCWDPHFHMLLRPPPLRAAETPTCCWDTHLHMLLRFPPPHAAESPTSPCCWDSHFHMLLRPPPPRAAETYMLERWGTQQHIRSLSSTVGISAARGGVYWHIYFFQFMSTQEKIARHRRECIKNDPLRLEEQRRISRKRLHPGVVAGNRKRAKDLTSLKPNTNTEGKWSQEVGLTLDTVYVINRPSPAYRWK